MTAAAPYDALTPDTVLDAIEAAIRANPARDRRNAIAHLTLVDPADELLGLYRPDVDDPGLARPVAVLV